MVHAGNIQGGPLRLFATLIEEGWWLDARIDHADPARKPLPKPDLRLMLVPLGPSTLVVACGSRDDLLAAARPWEGQLTATIHGTPEDLAAHRDLLAILEAKAGRLIFNGFPTGGEVCHAMNHGGPCPATGDGRSTSVGTRAITRFARPVCYQNFPGAVLPDALKDANPLGLRRLRDGKFGLE